MNIIRFILIAVEIVSCLMLIGVILLQQSKGGGMGTAFGGGMSETIFGSRAGNILTKVTITLAIVFLANTAILGIMYTSKTEGSIVDSAAVPAAPAAIPNPSPIAGGDQVPAPTQQGTLFTPDQEAAPVQASVVEPVEVPAESVVLDAVPEEVPATP